MKSSRNILVRWSSLLLASLMLFLAGWSHELPLPASGNARKATTQPQTGKKAGAPAEAKIQAASFEAVVTPASSFDFTQAIYLLPAPVFVFLLLVAASLLRIFTIPYFYFSYFRHVFGHFIAPNAP
ncbi:hypothetical protein [Arsenicibacter rosenii]|uniref:Uncharacterized protein n=1 Tax=Arsenicibacter rosenii TaxID=1750698 RepID=A0A1S2VEQ1_9BACT|nr:hypothetical protein [Arsenicibacter rosenii]OIN57231.1 hypothetical protein BLX24_20980 [Arsenicibacter rosenii]